MNKCFAFEKLGQHYFDERGYNGWRSACVICGTWEEGEK
jgi:hypothetical protein